MIFFTSSCVSKISDRSSNGVSSPVMANPRHRSCYAVKKRDSTRYYQVILNLGYPLLQVIIGAINEENIR